MGQLTKEIAGRELTLEAGVRFVAQQLLEEGGVVTVSIHRWDPFAVTSEDESALSIQGLSLDEADRLVAAFDGPGADRVRIW